MQIMLICHHTWLAQPQALWPYFLTHTWPYPQPYHTCSVPTSTIMVRYMTILSQLYLTIPSIISYLTPQPDTFFSTIPDYDTKWIDFSDSFVCLIFNLMSRITFTAFVSDKLCCIHFWFTEFVSFFCIYRNYCRHFWFSLKKVQSYLTADTVSGIFNDA